MAKNTLLLLCTLISSCFGQPTVETGTIEWGRNYHEALAQSQTTGKPLFLLFQEVPGCAGCKDFGREVLSNPLIKKSVEEAFIPIYIRNNASTGHDHEILKKFKEPAWNYQVVRFIGSDGKDLIPRKDRVWDAKSLAERMKKALKEAGQKIPPALDLVYLESDKTNHKQVAFSMFCYWTGEAELGKVNGVITTEAGWLDGHEVTLVTYHDKTISLENLHAAAEKVDCARAVYLPEGTPPLQTKSRLKIGKLDNSYRKAKSSDQKKQVEGTGIASSHFTPAQLTKINAWVRRDHKVLEKYL